jgi:hypothetical protein
MEEAELPNIEERTNPTLAPLLDWSPSPNVRKLAW